MKHYQGLLKINFIYHISIIDYHHFNHHTYLISPNLPLKAQETLRLMRLTAKLEVVYSHRCTTVHCSILKRDNLMKLNAQRREDERIIGFVVG